MDLYHLFSATYNATLSADLSVLFDVGGIVGAIAAGVLSDYSGMSASTCAVMLALACPMVNMVLIFKIQGEEDSTRDRVMYIYIYFLNYVVSDVTI